MKSFKTTLNEQGLLTVAVDVAGETMNVFNQQVIDDFEQLSSDIEEHDDIKAVIFVSGKEEGFIAGADIKMLQQTNTAKDGKAISVKAHTMLGRITNSRKPHIVAIDGVCLGAGYELALACHYRIATDNKKTKLGLPEVMLGLLPGGMGNTQLPRLISLPAALDILLSGKQLDSKRALRLGMIDEVVSPKILQRTAESIALRLLKAGIPNRSQPFKDKLMKLSFIKNFVIKKARKQVIKKTQGLYPAPLAILDVVEQGLNKPLDEALDIEATKFGDLTVSPEAKQLINIYFATTALKKENFIDTDVTPRTVKRLGILGGGLMGAGIAIVSIDKANASVRIKDIHDEGILKTFDHLNSYYKKRVQRRILSQEQAVKKINQLTGSLTYTGFQQCDLIIEAVFEDISLKHQMLVDIESIENENTVFASNTSSIPITDIASKAKRPQNVLGMHYFSPVEKMPLLEIIKHPGTSDQALITAIDFGKKQGKTVIVVKDGAGFYVNRILAPYINAALELGMDGIPFQHIDTALMKFGFPVGPIKLLDEVGIDVGSKIQPILESAFGERMQSVGVQQTFIDNNRLGKKVKKGFYQYANPKQSKQIDPDVYKELDIKQSLELPETAIVERCIYPMLNEAVMCLDDGIISNVRDGDIGAIFGIGFPPFLGGPFRYIDSLGLGFVVDTLKKCEEIHGIKYRAADLLIKMAKDNKTFYSE